MRYHGVERRKGDRTATPSDTPVPPRRSERTTHRTLAVVGLVALAVGVVLPVHGFGAPAARPNAPSVLAITQSKNTTANGTFTVSIDLASPSQAKFVFFLFCQLTHGVCYSPVVMTSQGGGWFAGTTKAMSNYPGMDPGIAAGYNITIEYTNNTNVTEPALPNAFSNLTVATSVTGAYYFRMTVRPLTFGLSGRVTDAATGAGVDAARVNLTPGVNWTVTDASGKFVFGDLFNGTYQLSVAKAGYHANLATVVVNGSAAVQNVAIQNATGPSATHPQSSGGLLATLEGPVGYAAVGAAAVVVVALAILLVRRRRSATAPTREATAEAEAPSPVPEPPGPGGR
ncbi:MAG TPA: carboxypeptidase-like regulatory domain-containing protein [Thermoplasmata archaeon]|nr:carboxypeptidase-like regulatory domain-containing protein [Thermoplasmata archaeon]